MIFEKKIRREPPCVVCRLLILRLLWPLLFKFHSRNHYSSTLAYQLHKTGWEGTTTFLCRSEDQFHGCSPGTIIMQKSLEKNYHHLTCFDLHICNLGMCPIKNENNINNIYQYNKFQAATKTEQFIEHEIKIHISSLNFTTAFYVKSIFIFLFSFLMTKNTVLWPFLSVPDRNKGLLFRCDLRDHIHQIVRPDWSIKLPLYR